MIKADLHIHTDISDGSLSTEEVIKKSKRKGAYSYSNNKSRHSKRIKRSCRTRKEIQYCSYSRR